MKSTSAVIFLLFVYGIALSYTSTHGVESSSLSDGQIGMEFGKFMVKYHKSYPSPDEEAYRFRTFKRNFKLIFEHNQYQKQLVKTNVLDASSNTRFKPTPSYTLEINQFADLTDDEHAMRFLGTALQLRSKRSVPLSNLIQPENVPSDFLAKEVDWRVKGAVTPIKNQKSCGSCWSFSATGAIEGAWYLKTGELVSLSEQQLVECSWAYGNQGCDGGLMDQAFEYVIKNNGIQSEDSYPYTAMDGSKCRFNRSAVVAKISSLVDVPSGDENSLMTAVNQQPVSVAIDAGLSSFRFYKQGVYYDKSCSSKKLNHGVLAVGYGTDPEMGDYWLVKNSWGTDWGTDGYIKIARNRNNHCGIATDASYPVV